MDEQAQRLVSPEGPERAALAVAETRRRVKSLIFALTAESGALGLGAVIDAASE
jgi:hypothetical protein